MKEIQQIMDLVKSCISKAEICEKLGWSYGGCSCRKLNKIISDNNLDISHFKPNGSHLRIKYQDVEKECPVCKEKFKTQLGHPKEKTTCSTSCANTYYRSGPNNGNYIEDRTQVKYIESKIYRSLFTIDELYCRRCGYNEFQCSIDIHHIDEDRDNNNKSNLVPLCSNCHKALHNKQWNLGE